jgi:hypothetical protein
MPFERPAPRDRDDFTLILQSTRRAVQGGAGGQAKWRVSDHTPVSLRKIADRRLAKELDAEMPARDRPPRRFQRAPRVSGQSTLKLGPRLV